jgi:outer membrane immunogenic protein
MKNLRLMFSAAVVGSAMLGIGTASAADLPMKAPPLAAAPPCVWCGFYVGVNAGYAGSESTSVNSVATVTSAAGLGGNLIFPAAAAAALTTPISVGNGNGFIGGGQVGYNFQASNFVAGIEADIQGLSGRGTGTVVTSVPIPVFQSFANATLTATNSVNWLGTVRGRIGLAVAPNFLLYGTGGLAYGGVRSSTGISEAIAGPGAVGSGLNGTFPALGSFSQTRAGWTAGAGGEWMFNGNWSAKLEYLHYDLGSATYGTTVSNFTVAPSPPGILLYTLGQTSTTSFRGDIVRVGLNYKFGAAPVVAKY